MAYKWPVDTFKKKKNDLEELAIRNANKTPNEDSLYSSYSGYHKDQKTVNAGKDVRKKVPQTSVGSNVK